MKLIIDIDEKIYNDLRNRGLTGMLTTKECACMNEAIYNGTPLGFGNISVEAIEELSHCPACIHYIQGDVPNALCNNCKNRDELYRRIKNER